MENKKAFDLKPLLSAAITPTLLVVIGYLLNDKLVDIKEDMRTLRSMEKTQVYLETRVNQIDNTVSLLQSRFDEHTSANHEARKEEELTIPRRRRP